MNALRLLMKNGSFSGIKTPTWSRFAVANADPNSRSSAISRNSIFRPSAAAALSITFLSAAYLGSRGRPINPIPPSLGTSCAANSRRFSTSWAPRKLTPLTLPPGRLRLATKPSLTGSLAVLNTMGMVAVDALAKIAAQLLPPVSKTVTGRLTSSTAIAGSCSSRPAAQRYSILTLWPSTKPSSLDPGDQLPQDANSHRRTVLATFPRQGLPAADRARQFPTPPHHPRPTG